MLSTFSGTLKALGCSISSPDISQSNCCQVRDRTSSEFLGQRKRPCASIRLYSRRKPSPSQSKAFRRSQRLPQKRYNDRCLGSIWSRSCTMAQRPSIERLISVYPHYPNVRIMRLILSLFLSSAFNLCPIIIAKIISKLRIIVILFHRSWLILPHHPTIQLFQIHQHYCFPWPLSAFQSMEMRIYGSFEWKYVPVFWIQVQDQLHFDTGHMPWFSGAYVGTAFAGGWDAQVVSFLHICSVFFLHFLLI